MSKLPSPNSSAERSVLLANTPAVNPLSNLLDRSRVTPLSPAKYLPITITINDEVDQFGNQGPVVVEQTKEERDAKAPKTYLGNVKVEWTNGQNVEPAPRDNQSAPAAPAPIATKKIPTTES